MCRSKGRGRRRPLVCLVNSEKAEGSGHSGGEEEGKGKWRRGNARRGTEGDRTLRESEAGKELSKRKLQGFPCHNPQMGWSQRKGTAHLVLNKHICIHRHTAETVHTALCGEQPSFCRNNVNPQRVESVQHLELLHSHSHFGFVKELPVALLTLQRKCAHILRRSSGLQCCPSFFCGYGGQTQRWQSPHINAHTLLFDPTLPPDPVVLFEP